MLNPCFVIFSIIFAALQPAHAQEAAVSTSVDFPLYNVAAFCRNKNELCTYEQQRAYRALRDLMV